MKSIIFVAVCFYFVQSCLAASLTLSDGDLKRIRFLLEELPGIEQKAVNTLVSYYETHRETPKNQMRNRLMNIAMQQNTCTKKAIDLKHMIVVAFKVNEKDVHEHDDLVSKLATCSEYQFETIETDLNRHHTPEKVQHVMKILHLIKICYTMPTKVNNEINAARADILVSMASGLNNGCPKTNHCFIDNLKRIIRPIIRLPKVIGSLFKN